MTLALAGQTEGPEPKRITDWDSLPILLTPKILMDALPPGVLGRDNIYGLWNIKGFPGLRLSGKLIVSRDGLRKWLDNPGA